MVKLSTLNGISPFGNGSDGVGPVSSAGLTGSSYNYTSWNITGIVRTRPTSSGVIFRVMNDLTIGAGASLICDLPDAVGATEWGSSTNGSSAMPGGAACGDTLSMLNVVSKNLWTTYRQAGRCGGAGGQYGYGNKRISIIVGGKITIDASVGNTIVANGLGTATLNTGGGGGGLIFILSAVGIETTGAMYICTANGYTGRNGGSTNYGGGGGGGGAVMICAPYMSGFTINSLSVLGGSFGGSTFAGGGNASGGGGSFGAGGNGGNSVTPTGWPGSNGSKALNSIHSMAAIM